MNTIPLYLSDFYIMSGPRIWAAAMYLLEESLLHEKNKLLYLGCTQKKMYGQYSEVSVVYFPACVVTLYLKDGAAKKSGFESNRHTALALDGRRCSTLPASACRRTLGELLERRGDWRGRARHQVPRVRWDRLRGLTPRFRVRVRLMISWCFRGHFSPSVDYCVPHATVDAVVIYRLI